MTIKKLAEVLDAEIICGNEDKEVIGGYSGDFLSVAMSKIKEHSVWFTIMNNINVAGVAVLTEVGCIVLCDSVRPSEQLENKAKSEGIPLICTKLTTFDAVAKYCASSVDYKVKD